MPTPYRFKLSAQKAEFYAVPEVLGRIGCAVAYGPGCTLKAEEFTGTLPEALARLEAFAAEAPAPSRSFLRVAPGERTPRGFKQATTHADHRGE